MSKPGSTAHEGKSPGKPQPVPTSAKSSRTRVWLGAAAGLVVVVILIVVGVLVFGGDDSGDGAVAQSSATNADSQGATTSLQETAQRFVAALDDASEYTDQKQALAVIEKFGEPRCIDFLLQVRDSLESDTAPKPPPRTSFARTSTKLMLVQEQGDNGVVVATTNGREETYYWLRQADDRWLFTCQGMLGGANG